MLVNPPKNMPSRLRKMYAHFVGYYTAALELRSTYTDLYLRSVNEKLLSKQEIIMFALALRTWMIQQQFIGIARMTDPVGKVGEENLSIEGVVSALPVTEIKLRNSLLKRAVAIRVAAKSIRKHRHKHIAHSDVRYATGQKKLRSVRHKKVDAVLAAIGKVLHRLHNRYEGSSIDYRPRGFADVILRQLAKAEAYEQLERQKVIPWDSWRTYLPR